MVKGWLEKLPYPIAGLMLGLATLGNTLGSYGSWLRTMCGSFSFIILVLIIGKMIVFPKSIKKNLSILPIASVAATFPMGIIILTTYTKSYIPEFSKIIWWLALLINISIIIYFTFKHLWPLKLQKFYASYFVTYIGIVVASVTAKGFEEIMVGKIAFIFGLICFIVLLPVVTYRYAKETNVGEPLKSLIVIYAAPANLLVLGYLGLNLSWSNLLLDTLYGVGVVSTVFAWYQITRIYRLPFYPSFAAYTFPLVIGAFTTKTYYVSLIGRNIVSRPIEIFGFVQLVIACGLVMYVMVRYVIFIFFNNVKRG